jgi:hypothetical protein
MAAHPSPSVSLPFSLEHTAYLAEGTLSMSFLLLVEKAEHLVSSADISKDMIPPLKAIKPMKTTAMPPKAKKKFLFSLQNILKINNQQASTKQLCVHLVWF